MGIYSERLEETLKKNNMNIKLEDENLDSNIEEMLAKVEEIERQNPEQFSGLRNKASSKIMKLIELKSSELIDSNGNLNIEVIKKEVDIVQKEVVRNELNDEKSPKEDELDKNQEDNHKEEAPILEESTIVEPYEPESPFDGWPGDLPPEDLANLGENLANQTEMSGDNVFGAIIDENTKKFFKMKNEDIKEEDIVSFIDGIKDEKTREELRKLYETEKENAINHKVDPTILSVTIKREYVKENPGFVQNLFLENVLKIDEYEEFLEFCDENGIQSDDVLEDLRTKNGYQVTDKRTLHTLLKIHIEKQQIKYYMDLTKQYQKTPDKKRFLEELKRKGVTINDTVIRGFNKPEKIITNGEKRLAELDDVMSLMGSFGARDESLNSNNRGFYNSVIKNTKSLSDFYYQFEKEFFDIDDLDRNGMSFGSKNRVQTGNVWSEKDFKQSNSEKSKYGLDMFENLGNVKNIESKVSKIIFEPSEIDKLVFDYKETLKKGKSAIRIKDLMGFSNEKKKEEIIVRNKESDNKEEIEVSLEDMALEDISFEIDSYDSLFSSFEQELGIEEKEEEVEEITDLNVAKLNKKITGPASLTKVMAKPKEMVLDYLEMDINSGTDPKNATLVMADMLRDKKLLTKFKGASETGLSLEEYAEIMSGVVIETEQLIEEGKLPETITENGVDRQTSIDDFINMTFDDTEILLSNLPGRISDLSKEEIAALITAKVKEAEQELQQETPEVEEIQEQESEQKIFTKTISSIFPIEETKKQGIDLSKVGLEDFVEVLDAFASGDKAYLMQVLMKQTTKEMKYLIDNFKNTLGMRNYIEQNGFVPKEVMDKWKQMEAEGKDPFEEMRKAPEEREATVEEAKKQEELAQKLAEQQRQEKQVEEPQKETGLIRNEDRSLMQKASAGFKNFFESAKEKVGKFFESVKEKFARKPDEKFGSEVYAMDATKKDKEQENDMWQRVDPREHAEKVAKQQEEKRQAIENGQEKATVNVGEKEER